MLQLHRSTLISCCLALITCVILYATIGVAKPLSAWKWTDIVSEGGTAVLAGSWLLFTLSSRPGGLVTRLLAGGLAMIMVGSFADCMDEFFAVNKADVWDNWLEALVPFGMLVLTCGMYYWRHEQFRLNEHLQKRERLFRDHRAFDRITQLANADYLRRQIRLEQAQRPDQPCALVLLDIDGFQRIGREHGQREGDRVLQAVGHMLLLNLRNDDLLCRYAGDRFALLMPGTSADEAEALARHLAAMVGQMRHHARDGRVQITLRHASARADDAAETVLAELGRRLSAQVGAAQAGPAPTTAGATRTVAA